MKTANVAQALVCAFTAVVEVLPTQHRRSVNNILRSAIADGMVDNQTARVLKRLVDEPPPHRRRPGGVHL
jgi:hypothetical protein